MEQFNLEKYLENPSCKIITRDGKPVRIVCTDSPIPHHTIVGFVECDLFTWTDDGKVIYGGKCEDKNDLFFADEEEKSIEIPFGAYDSEFIRDEYLIPDGYEARIEGNKVIIEKIQKEEELTEFEKEVKHFMCYCCEDVFVEDVPEYLKEISTKLLDLARKELKKEFKDEEYFRLITEHYKQGKQDALKSLPKWKKITEEKQNYLAYGYLSNDGYYLNIQELKDKLPKED